jgi:flavin reductase (DIM6/NTAB) family NADH-FMN oxidoreductase RutF
VADAYPVELGNPVSMSKQFREPFSGRDYRDMVSLFPTGAAVIATVNAAGERLGVTISSFVSISLDPPLVAFSLSKGSKGLDDWTSATSFSINFLEEGQSELSTRFARAGTDKWRGLQPVYGDVTGAPLLEGALASIECSRFAQYDGGDHLIFLGRVLSFLSAAGTGKSPLVFHASRYRQLDRDDQRNREDAFWLGGW